MVYKEIYIYHIYFEFSELFSVAFHAVVDGHPVIDKGTNVKFNVVTLNDGNGYLYFGIQFFIFYQNKNCSARLIS